jgi:hypothetical protein
VDTTRELHKLQQKHSEATQRIAELEAKLAQTEGYGQ